MTDDPVAAELDAVRERGRIEGDLTEWLSMKVWDEYHSLRLGSANFRPLYSEECEELGYDDDDGTILLRREPDGAVFEVDIDVSARKTDHVLGAPGGKDKADG